MPRWLVWLIAVLAFLLILYLIGIRLHVHTASAQTFPYTLPTGPQGPTGAAGPTGPTGAGGMANWGIAEWTVFGTVIVAAFSGIATSIIAIVKAVQAGTKAEANTSALDRTEQNVNARMTNVTNAVNTAQATASTALLHAAPPSQGQGQSQGGKSDLPNVISPSLTSPQGLTQMQESPRSGQRPLP